MADFEGISLSDVGKEGVGYQEIMIHYNLIEPKMHKRSSNPIEIKCDADLKEAWEHCCKNSKSVELLYENEDSQKTLAKVHFRFDPKVPIHACNS